MQAAIIAKWGIAIMGVAVMLCAFWSYAVKKMTADLSVIWEFVGAALFLVGVVPALSGWLYLLSTGSTLVLLCGMAVFIWSGVGISLRFSTLTMRTQELAQRVSLLNEENARLMQILTKKKAETMENAE